MDFGSNFFLINKDLFVVWLVRRRFFPLSKDVIFLVGGFRIETHSRHVTFEETIRRKLFPFEAMATMARGFCVFLCEKNQAKRRWKASQGLAGGGNVLKEDH